MGAKANPMEMRANARLASLAANVSGGGAAAAEPAAVSSRPARNLLEPDLSRIRPRGIDETEEQRRRRLAAKTVNFSMSFLARTVILAALAMFAFSLYERTGSVHRGIGALMFVIFADFGRAILKAMEPGTK